MGKATHHLVALGLLSVCVLNPESWKVTAFSELPVETKGDLIDYGGDGKRLPVGTNGVVLTTHCGATNGIKWDTTGFGTVTSFYAAPSSIFDVAQAGPPVWFHCSRAQDEPYVPEYKEPSLWAKAKNKAKRLGLRIVRLPLYIAHGVADSLHTWWLLGGATDEDF